MEWGHLRWIPSIITDDDTQEPLASTRAVSLAKGTKSACCSHSTSSNSAPHTLIRWPHWTPSYKNIYRVEILLGIRLVIPDDDAFNEDEEENDEKEEEGERLLKVNMKHNQQVIYIVATSWESKEYRRNDYWLPTCPFADDHRYFQSLFHSYSEDNLYFAGEKRRGSGRQGWLLM